MVKKKADVKKEEKTDPGVAEQLKEPDIELVNELVRYDYSDAELVELASSMADMMKRTDRLKAEKKSAASNYDSEIKKVELDLQTVSESIQNRFDMRNADCHLVRDYDIGNRKAYYFRADQCDIEHLTGWGSVKELVSLIYGGVFKPEPVKIRDLKSWEIQKELEFGDKDEYEIEEKSTEELVDEETSEQPETK